jgi:lysozyme
VAREFNAGRWRKGCDGFGAWVNAGGKRVQGLVNRRADERALCLKDAA